MQVFDVQKTQDIKKHNVGLKQLFEQKIRLTFCKFCCVFVFKLKKIESFSILSWVFWVKMKIEGRACYSLLTQQFVRGPPKIQISQTETGLPVCRISGSIVYFKRQGGRTGYPCITGHPLQPQSQHRAKVKVKFLVKTVV